RPARDDQRVPVAEAGVERRELDALGEQPPLVEQVPERVLCEAFERLGHPAPLLGERPGKLFGLECPAVRQAAAVAEDARAANADILPVAELVEQRRAGRVDQPHTAPHEQERARVREAAGLGARHVHDDSHAGLEQLFGRDTVDVLVVDDRDVAWPEAADEVLGAAAEARPAGELDEAHRSCWTAAMNCSPPSMRCSSSRRSSSPSSAIVVCVGSPGTFSTRKWRSASDAICGRCVIVTTWARSARRRSVSPTACAVWPPIPASISSKTIVSPPPTAAIARAIRESSPPEAVSATGANGSPAFGRIRNETSSARPADGSRSPSSTRNSPSPRVPTLASASASACAAAAAGSVPPSSASSSARASVARASSSS